MHEFTNNYTLNNVANKINDGNSPDKKIKILFQYQKEKKQNLIISQL